MCDENETIDAIIEPDRRGLLRIGTLAFLLTMLPPWLTRAGKRVAIKIGKLKGLEQIGGAKRFKLRGHPILLIRDSETTVKAFNPTCTHKKCKVRYDREAKRFNCKCHKSAYDEHGNPVYGPAPRPLSRYKASLSQGRVIITLPAETP